MTRCSRTRPSGWLLPSVSSAGICVLLTIFSSTAFAAGEGESCGRFGPWWSEGCDDGLTCELEGRGTFWFRIGVCVRPSCGGLQGLQCGAGEFCDFAPEANCGFADQTGTCRVQPEVCTREYRPVCGCDGLTYGNPCTANAAGVSIAREGACEWCQSDDECPHGRCESTVTCAGLDCPPPPPAECVNCGDGSQLICLALPAPCPEGEVREIVGGCYGECVDPATCETGSTNTCDYEGVTYQVGESFPSIDGCNTCSCSEGGLVACTERACECDRDDPNRSYVSESPEQCAAITFICVPGFQPFFDACGCGCERICRVGGCSGQLCVGPGEPDITTCEWREEYACYDGETCEQQPDGSCGWRQTDQLIQCLDEAREGAAAQP